LRIDAIGFFNQRSAKVFTGGLLWRLLQYSQFSVNAVNLDKAMKMPSAKAQKYVQTRYFLRYLITGVVIYVAIINPWVNIVGVLLGLIAVKISVLINTTVSKKNVLINKA